MKLLTALLALAMAYPGLAEISIPYVPEDEIQLDGQLDDWSEVMGPPLLTASDFRLSEGHHEWEKPLYMDFDPENLDFRIWMGWSTLGRVFLAVDFMDDFIRDEPTALFVKSDGVVFSVTSTGSEAYQPYAVRPRWIKPYPYTGGSPNWSSRAPVRLRRICRPDT